jgi:Na+-driven multidrug efflux pump
LAISGLAITFPLMNLAAAFGSLVGVGASTWVSVKLGERDYEGANHVLGNVLVLNVILGLLFTVVFLCFLDPILLFFGASDVTLPYAHDYMVVILLGNVVTHLYFGLNAVLRASGFPEIGHVCYIGCGCNQLHIESIVYFWIRLGNKRFGYCNGYCTSHLSGWADDSFLQS